MNKEAIAVKYSFHGPQIVRESHFYSYFGDSFMNNEAIAVRCSLHGPQIVRESHFYSYFGDSFMNNEAIAVRCSLHGPQIVRESQLSSHTRIFSNYCRPWERSGHMHYVTCKINY